MCAHLFIYFLISSSEKSASHAFAARNWIATLDSLLQPSKKQLWRRESSQRKRNKKLCSRTQDVINTSANVFRGAECRWHFVDLTRGMRDVGERMDTCLIDATPQYSLDVGIPNVNGPLSSLTVKLCNLRISPTDHFDATTALGIC